MCIQLMCNVALFIPLEVHTVCPRNSIQIKTTSWTYSNCPGTQEPRNPETQEPRKTWTQEPRKPGTRNTGTNLNLPFLLSWLIEEINNYESMHILRDLINLFQTTGKTKISDIFVQNVRGCKKAKEASAQSLTM